VKFSLDLSVTLDNPLYHGCELEEVAGRMRIKGSPARWANVLGRNAESLLEQMMAQGIDELTLTGATAIWVYLIVFHSAVHRFREIYYDDGKKDGRVRISAH
jgi:hypothetical protein